MVALIPVACQTAPDPGTPPLLSAPPQLLLYSIYLGLPRCHTHHHICRHMHHHLHTFPVSSPVIQPHSLSLSLFQSVSQSVAQLLSQSVVQSTLPCRLPSLLACAVYTHLICQPPPAWLDSIFFEYNSQPAKEVWERERRRGKKIDVDGFWHLHRRLAPCHCAEKLACPTDFEAHFNEEWYVATAISRIPLYIRSDHSTLHHASPQSDPIRPQQPQAHGPHDHINWQFSRLWTCLLLSKGDIDKFAGSSDLKLFLLLFYQHICSRGRRKTRWIRFCINLLAKFDRNLI